MFHFFDFFTVYLMTKHVFFIKIDIVDYKQIYYLIAEYRPQTILSMSMAFHFDSNMSEKVYIWSQQHIC